jgi:hypothetical protein
LLLPLARRDPGAEAGIVAGVPLWCSTTDSPPALQLFEISSIQSPSAHVADTLGRRPPQGIKKLEYPKKREYEECVTRSAAGLPYFPLAYQIDPGPY